MSEASYSARPAPQAGDDELDAQATDNGETLAYLYATHAARLYRYFRIHTRSRAQAEDLVSETFLHVLRSLAGYSPERGAFSPWLYSIARRALARQVSQSSTLASADEPALSVAALARTAVPAVTPDDRIDLWQAVAELPEDEQEVVALKFGAGLSYLEIGRIMETSTNRVGVLLYRALQRLRERLGAEGDGDAK